MGDVLIKRALSGGYHSLSGRQTGRQAGRLTARQAGRQADRQAGRQTDILG